MNIRTRISFLILATLPVLYPEAGGQDVLAADELLAVKSCGDLQLKPDGTGIIYSVSAPRGPNEKPGPPRTGFFRMSVPGGEPVPLFPEGVDGSSPRWSPDGSHIGFLWSENGEPAQVWVMPAGGGGISRLTATETDVTYFRWQPGNRGLAYLSLSPPSAREKELEDRGYDFIYFEENLRHNNLYLTWFDNDWKQAGLRQLTENVTAWDFEFNEKGDMIAASISPENLIDHRYMFRRIYLVDTGTGERKQVSQNEGKLGNYAFGPDGRYLAYSAALNLNDNQVSQAFVVELEDGTVRNLTPGDFRGHVEWVGWKDASTLLYYAGEGVYPTLNQVPVAGGKRKTLLDASHSGIIFGIPEFTAGFSNAVFTGSTPRDPVNIYYLDGKREPVRITDLNPGIANRELGTQEVVRYQARDGQEIEALLVYPVQYEQGQTYPLVVYVHGGPESHYSNEWVSSYSTPVQVMAGKGYLVLLPNYRASTGYGVEFAMEGFMDPAGKEFDDLADGIEYVVREKGADPERVGMAGGSYGGYASAWFATYYTRYVKAVCMFVGVSNNISRRGTTDIPWEERYVHSGKPLEEQWQLSLERSPVYWAHQSRTATLIYGGAADTRVHPSQGLELFRRMKMNGHPAVRLVQYPGEEHGNRMQVGRMDVLYRQVQWMDWYVRDMKPLEGPMPPLDISDSYGLDWQF